MSKAKKTVVINEKEYIVKKSKFCINESPVHVSDSMSGKMTGIPSISTSCLCNPICIQRMKDGNSVCSHCFAEATLSRYKDCGKAMESNYNLLNDSVLPIEYLPVFGNVQIARIESFGDIASVTQAINYANICKVNPSVRFAWWTKNASILKKAFDIVGKPENVVIIESAPLLNKEIKKSNEYIDKTFTVFSKEDGNCINCGSRKCFSCQVCYRKDTTDNIHELLK